MRRNTEIEMERLKITKSVRKWVRHRHSLLADELVYPKMPKLERTAIRLGAALDADAEINDLLPNLITQFDQQMMRGNLYGWDDESQSLTFIRALKILDFDCECRPMAFYGGDWVTKELTAIAWRFVDEPEDSAGVWLLKPSKTLASHDAKKRKGLEKFVKAYNKADIVTGHYIRGFDLPLVNGALIRSGLPPLAPKMAHDTKGDLIRLGGMSKSQQNLGATVQLDHDKESMNTYLWETANALVQEGIRETRRRVVGDVQQHVEFREELLSRGALMPPQVWTSGAKTESYHA